VKQVLNSEVMLRDVVVSAVLRVAQELITEVDTEAPDPGPCAVPRDLRLWLARLRLLEGVPFGHLVADPALLPPESIRFFHVDRGWIDALAEGALSVGTVTTGDRAALESLYGTVRAEVDEAERLVRLPGWQPGAKVPVGLAGPLSGFVLRSRMVSGWPGLHVRAYANDNLRLARRPVPDDQVGGEMHDEVFQRLALLRLERLSPAVLLALFDGVPQVVHLEEPRAGVQFGVDETGGEGDDPVVAKVVLRNLTTGERFPDGRSVDVRFRANAPGVVHMAATARAMVAKVRPPGDTARLDAAELALQMLQFPYRAVFGDRSLSGGEPLPPGAMFQPVVGLALLRQRFAGDGVDEANRGDDGGAS
jgi:hypothetical protein